MMRPNYKDSIYNVPRYKGAYLIYYFALLLNKIKIFIQVYMTCLFTLIFPLLLPLMCALPTIDQFIPSFIAYVHDFMQLCELYTPQRAL